MTNEEAESTEGTIVDVAGGLARWLLVLSAAKTGAEKASLFRELEKISRESAEVYEQVQP
jgi:hypothetical protein